MKLGIAPLLITLAALPYSVVAETPARGAALVDVKVPTEYSPRAAVGKVAFENKCAKCHGENGSGRMEMGPPLIHQIYEPNHHGDEAFIRAATMGVRSHHWPFGNMPPVENITVADVKSIIAFVRETQVANGIK